MKKIIQLNAARQSSKIFFALGVACIINHYVIGIDTRWLFFSTLVVMLTATGSALYQGLWRFFLLSCVVIIGSLIFSSMHWLSMRLYSVALGAVIGILVNIIVLPDRVDVACRHALIPILKCYGAYFSALIVLLLEKKDIAAEKEKITIEKKIQTLPAWVYEAGFDLVLQKGYCYFFMKVGQMGEILFAMHYLARHSFSDELLNVIREPLSKCVMRVEQFIEAIVTVLELKKLSEGIVDFSVELAEMEEQMKVIAPVTLEACETPTDYIYLTEFIYHLRDLRSVLLRMTEALR